MPKKYNPQYAKPTAPVHPSLQSSRPATTSSPPPSTVNERIRQLRREQAPRAARGRENEINEVVTAINLPPALRRLLNMTEVNPPRQKADSRARVGQVRTRRPPPGPAAPNSWLQHSRHAPRRERALNTEDDLVDRFTSLATLEEGDYKRLPPYPSLVHFALKTFALNWEDLVEYEQFYIAALPYRLKESLLSYISRYGPYGCMDLHSFKTIFLNETEVDGGNGSEDITFLDLTGLLNPRFTLLDLYKYMGRPKSVTLPATSEPLPNSKGKEKAAGDEVLDSWEDEADEMAPTIPLTVTTSRFPLLTRLSLAHAGSQASWPQLLTLSSKLHTLTHLSLAYWPTPSSTPNAATASMVSNITRPINLGGSSLYSELEDDWHEAANILRRLSKNTYCLRWLDLEGCTWVKALTWNTAELSQSIFNRMSLEGWVGKPKENRGGVGPDWTDAWGQIAYLNLSQGWVPRNTADIRRMPAGVIPVQLLNWLRNQEDEEEGGATTAAARGGMKPFGDAEEWVEREKVAREVANTINRYRKLAKGCYCKVDCGWNPSLADVKKKEDAV